MMENFLSNFFLFLSDVLFSKMTQEKSITCEELCLLTGRMENAGLTSLIKSFCGRLYYIQQI
jgi:hypothetical protein